MALRRSTPSAESVAAGSIRSFVDALESSPGIEPHSLMLLRHGRVFAETSWAPYGPDQPQLLYSLSKSFTSAALGLAIDEGLVTLDDTVLSHFPHLDAVVTDERSRAIRVRDVAAMASGHRIDLIHLADELDASDLVRGLLTIPPDEAPGSLFTYNQTCTYALAAIVQARSGASLTEYLRPRLLEPLGIGATRWLRDGAGRELGYSGLHATTEAVAALGQLHLDGGRWNGRQLLPAQWVAEATREQVANPDEPNPDWRQGYGFQFWMARHGYRGDGAYGQFCVVLPEHDAVLAMTAQTEDMQAVLDAAWEHLLPAFDGVADTATDAALAEFLATRKLAPASGPLPGEDAANRGFAAVPGNDQPTLTEVRLSRDAHDWKVELVDAGHHLSAQVGMGEWRVAGALAVSAGTDAAGRVRVDIAVLDTPHRLALTCDPLESTFVARWVTQPLHGVALAEYADSAASARRAAAEVADSAAAAPGGP